MPVTVTVTLSGEELRKFSPAFQAELLAYLSTTVADASVPALAAPSVTDSTDYSSIDYDGIDYDGVVDITPSQAGELISGICEKYANCLRLFAEHGPVINGSLVAQLGITNFSNLQMSVSKRTRTVTGNKKARLLAFDNWEFGDGRSVVSGRYAVTPATCQALKSAFGYS